MFGYMGLGRTAMTKRDQVATAWAWYPPLRTVAADGGGRRVKWDLWYLVTARLASNLVNVG